MIKKISIALALVATVANVSASEESQLDIFTGKAATAEQIEVSTTNLKKQANFAELYNSPASPLSEYSVTGPLGTITVYKNGAGQSQIRGTHKGAQFNSDGPTQIPFTGRQVGTQGNSKFVQFFSPKATIIVAQNYPASNLSAQEKSLVEAMAPGAIQGGVVKTAVVMAKPSGMEVVAGYNVVVPLN